jgi:hypothetical protein
MWSTIQNKFKERVVDMNILSVLSDLMNGKKFNSGTAVTLIAAILYMAFQQFGITNEQTVSWATLIVGAFGAVLAIVGLIHRWIKAAREKKELLKTAGEAGKRIIPLLVIGIFSMAIFSPAGAATRFVGFDHFVEPNPTMSASYNNPPAIPDTLIGFKLNTPITFLGLSRGPGNQWIRPQLMKCFGLGLALQKQVNLGKNKTLLSGSADLMFFPNGDSTAVIPFDIGAGIIFSSGAINDFGLGVAVNCGKVEGRTINRFVGMIVWDWVPRKN